ncbi:hypothetical protein [Flavobacterium adhaerens]|uniref:hypothetical protein n=1 Tax=Flavobacterium adhaerens TaxID=3149043 RepID=UPI0032B5BBC0
MYTDDSKETLHQNPAIWEKNEKTAVVILKGKKPIRQITLDGGIFMDATPLNNKWSAK